MEILQIVALGLVVTIFLVLLRQQRPELAVHLSIAFGAVIFVLVLGQISSVLNVFEEISNRANVNPFYLSTLLKIIGVAYIAEFGAQVARDAGENAVAGKVEFAAKILVMVLAVPILVAILESVMRLMP